MPPYFFRNFRPIRLQNHWVTKINMRCPILNNNLYMRLCETLHHSVKACSSSIFTSKRGRKKWWTDDCTDARRHNRLFHYIWKSCGRPSDGNVYECYKLTRKEFRRCCRRAVNDRSKQTYKLIEKLYKEKTPAKMWNVIRKTKSSNENTDGISLDTLVDHFKQKFSICDTTEFINLTKQDVEQKFQNICNNNTEYHDYVISENKIRNYIKKLKHRSAPGLDGITAEHLLLALDSTLPLHISNMLSLCIKYGILPDMFCKGLLIPILKKSNLDPSSSKSYRPITVSVVFSKILEHFLLDQFQSYTVNKAQFGFVADRGTGMAAALAHDLGSYCVDSGSPVYYCSLDAEGVFDALPHPILLKKAVGVLPDLSWRVLHFWYSHMSVCIKWKSCLSEGIVIERGTRQGGLSSPILFNLFYNLGLIDTLQSISCGIHINNVNFNTICYADDILLCSTTVTGLQKMINIASDYIHKHGLRFNPHKTSCLIMGANPFVTPPIWTMEGETLNIETQISYLGTVLGKKCERAFYGLQGAGIKFPGVAPHIIIDIYNTAIRSILTYGCTATYLTKTNLLKLDRYQGKIIKQCLGLNNRSRTTPLLKAMCVDPISVSVSATSMELLKACVLRNSLCQDFYCTILLKGNNYLKSSKTLAGRVSHFCIENDISIMKYIFDDKYSSTQKKCVKQNSYVKSGSDGLTESIRYLLSSDYNWNNCCLLNNLLASF